MAKINSGVSTSGMSNVTSGYQLQVTNTSAITQAGIAIIGGRNDDGTISAGGRNKNIYVSEGLGRISIGYVNKLWDDTFNYTSQNTSKYKVSTTTQTITFSNGTAILNGSNITTANSNCVLQTYRTFPLFAKSETRLTISALHTATPPANVVMELGCFTIASNATAPSDGVFFRYDATGVLKGVISYSGSETSTSSLTIPTSGVNHDYSIIIQTNSVSFYIDDVLRDKIILSINAPTQGQPMMSAALPITVRQYIASSTPSVAIQFAISDIMLGLNGPDLNRSWSETQPFAGYNAYEGQEGGVLGTTALYSNSLLANTGAIINNNSAAAGTGFGGQFTVQPILTASTDGILCSFQNPSGSTNQTPRNLFIKGVKINGSVNQTITGGPVLYAYSLAYGHTSVDMATTTTSTTKAPIRIAVGYESYGANAISGTTSTANPYFGFTAPIMVAPSEFVAICAKNLGTVTSGGLIVINVSFDAYYE